MFAKMVLFYSVRLIVPYKGENDRVQFTEKRFGKLYRQVLIKIK